MVLFPLLLLPPHDDVAAAAATTTTTTAAAAGQHKKKELQVQAQLAAIGFRPNPETHLRKKIRPEGEKEREGEEKGRGVVREVREDNVQVNVDVPHAHAKETPPLPSTGHHKKERARQKE